MEVVASLSQGCTAAAQCGLFTYKSVPVIFEPPCNITVQMQDCAFLVYYYKLEIIISRMAPIAVALCRLINFYNSGIQYRTNCLITNCSCGISFDHFHL